MPTDSPSGEFRFTVESCLPVCTSTSTTTCEITQLGHSVWSSSRTVPKTKLGAKLADALGLSLEVGNAELSEGNGLSVGRELSFEEGASDEEGRRLADGEELLDSNGTS